MPRQNETALALPGWSARRVASLTSGVQIMAKSQDRGGREPKKPKASAKKPAPVSVFSKPTPTSTTPSGSGRK